MAKSPVIGTVAYVSKRGTEIHLVDDPKRYRGVKASRSWQMLPGCTTYPLFYVHDVQVGDTVRLQWGGFARLNIAAVEILRHHR